MGWSDFIEGGKKKKEMKIERLQNLSKNAPCLLVAFPQLWTKISTADTKNKLELHVFYIA